ncbi:endo-1,4-beta-xylanase 1-like isoform X1 [Typha latifolia]|uniref:endo-1,4-beta-xylanase 1-like isoform X1 n=1 Tax=Typha latifolia TaxID=4733 RepID=UPI003C2CE076
MKRWFSALCRRGPRRAAKPEEIRRSAADSGSTVRNMNNSEGNGRSGDLQGSSANKIDPQGNGRSSDPQSSSTNKIDPEQKTGVNIDSHNSSTESIISNHDFSEGMNSWHPNCCNAFVASDESSYHHGVRPNSGTSYAIVTSRTENWQGLEHDITGKVTPDTKYTVLAYVRIHGDLQGPAGVQATLKLENQDSSTSYLSIERVLASKDCWEKLEGSFSLAKLPKRAVFYLEGPPPGLDLLIDSAIVYCKKTDTVVTSEISHTNSIISNHDFSQGLYCWNPICCHAYVASEWSGFLNGVRGYLGENYAVATKRAEHWQGLEQDITGKISVGTLYSVSAYVRIYGGIQGSTAVQATLRLEYPDFSTSYLCIERVLASEEHWVKLEGSFSLTTMPKSVVFYLEGPPPSVDLLIDSVTISCSALKQFEEVNTMPLTAGEEKIIQNPRFENGLNNWSGRGCKILRHESAGHRKILPLNGNYFASATQRSQSWNGIQQEITDRVQPKLSYEVSAFVRIFGNSTYADVKATLWIQSRNGREQYISVAKTQASEKEWVHLQGKFLLHGAVSKALIFLEGPPAGIDILLDSLVITRATKVPPAPLPNFENVLYGVNIIKNSTLNDGLSGWAPLGSCRLSVCLESPHMVPSVSRDTHGHHQHLSYRYILTTNRTETWMGPSQTITDKLKLHLTYQVSAWVRVGSGANGSQHVNVALGVDSKWVNGGQVEADADRWYEVRGSFRIEKHPAKVTVYVQGPSPGVDLMVMGLLIFPVDRKARYKHLKEKTEKVRKRDVILKFEGSDLSSVVGASLRIRQTDNSFPFGTCIGRLNLENDVYTDFFLKNFNWAVFENELKWYWTEAEQGKLNYRDADEMLDFCRRHGKEVRGHCIFWEVEDAVQTWLRSLDSNRLMIAVQDRLRGLLSRYRGKFRHHDVNNEMLHGSFYQDRLGKDIRAYMFREAHQLDPSAVLFVNDYNVEDGCDPKSTPEKYVQQILDLQERGAPVGGIGTQCHIDHPVGEIICAALDKLAILGLPIWLTELDVSASNEYVRADDLEVVLREAYAHPSVEGVVLWGFWELIMFRQNSHLVDADGTLNEAGRRYLALKQEWLSHADGHIDGHGEFKFRGYHGTYIVEITTASNKISHSFVVEKGDSPLLLAIKL